MRNCIKDYSFPFAAWDLRLYLNTHPYDKKAYQMYKQLCEQHPCIDNYACVPEDSTGHDCWTWIDDPWPWEHEANISTRRVQ